MMFQGFGVTQNSTGSDVWPGGGVAAWYLSQSAVTREASSLSEKEEEEEDKMEEDEQEKWPHDRVDNISQDITWHQ